jgi:acylphosphatase
VKTIILKVKGNVQGIGFRQNIKAAADDRSIAGYAQNQKDGTVEIAMQGGERQVNEIIEMINMSPAYTDAEEVEVRKEDFPAFNEFAIKVDADHTQTNRFEARAS